MVYLHKIFFLFSMIQFWLDQIIFSSFTALKTIEGICFVFVYILLYYNNLLIEMSQILQYATFSFIFNNRFIVCVIGLGRFTSKILSMFFVSCSSSFLFWFYKFFKTSFISMLSFIFPYANLCIFFSFLFYWYCLSFFFGLILFNLKVLSLSI